MRVAVRGHRPRGVLRDQVGVDVRRRRRPAGRGGPDLRDQVGDVARDPDTGHRGRGRPGRPGCARRPARVLHRRQPEVGQEAGPRDHPRRDHHRVAARPAGRPASAPPPAGRRRPRRRATSPSTTAMPRAANCSACSSVGAGVVRREEGDVGAPLPEQQRLVHRHRAARQHADGPVADLPPVAVRAVQHVAAPPLAQPRHVRELVDQAGGHQQPARPHRAAVGQRHGEPVAVADGRVDLPVHDPPAVAAAPRPGPARAARRAACPRGPAARARRRPARCAEPRRRSPAPTAAPGPASALRSARRHRRRSPRRRTVRPLGHRDHLHDDHAPDRHDPANFVAVLANSSWTATSTRPSRQRARGCGRCAGSATSRSTSCRRRPASRRARCRGWSRGAAARRSSCCSRWPGSTASPSTSWSTPRPPATRASTCAR